jgi:uncharacterized repeat protein (TIGR03803 family)
MPTPRILAGTATGRPRNPFVALLCQALTAVVLAPAVHAQTATESVVYDFTGKTDSRSPDAALIQGPDGVLYGTAAGDFISDFGEVFKISLAGTLTPVYRFLGHGDSATPLAPVLLGGDGNLYGTTRGNLFGSTYGMVYQLTAASGTLTSLFSFSAKGNPNGGNPASGLIEGSDGSFYGAAMTGGSSTSPLGYGTLFKVTSSGALTTLFTFNNIPDGAGPASPPIEGSDGNFYGVTQSGTQHNFGTVYKLTPTGVLTTLYTFTGTGDGLTPSGPLVEGPDGNFYGATGANATVSQAQGGNGTIFMITPAGALTTLHVFTSATDGEGPSGLFLASDGNLYGTTYGGGANTKGTIFSVTRTGTFTTLYSFGGTTGDGSASQAGLLQANDGNFYGTTAAGGTSGDGTVFKLTLPSVLAAPVQITPSAVSVPLGSPVTLTWQVLNAFSKTLQQCYASVIPSGAAAGAWAGLQSGTYSTTTQIYSGSATVTPTLPGTYLYGLTCGGMESGTATVAVGNASSLLITTSSLPAASVGVPYSAAIGASGGVQPYTFSVTAGSLPPGLTLDASTGVISGTPTQAGTSTFSVQVQDSNPVTAATATASFTMTVVVPLVITNTTLPADRIGIAYSQTLTASGGTPPYIWSLSGTSVLPTGLALSTQGVISGTPTAAGTTNFTLQVTDSASQVAGGAFSITIESLIDSTGAVTLTPASIAIGQTTVVTVQLTAITAPAGSPAPTGSVQFQSNGVNLGSPVPLASGTASLTTGAFSATGSFNITAGYSGDSNYLTKTYPAAILAVTTVPVPAIGITPSSVSVAPGAEASLTVTVLNFSSSSIAFSCSHLPLNVSCVFGTLDSAGMATLAIRTESTAALHGRPHPSEPVNDPRLAFIFAALPGFRGRVRMQGPGGPLRKILPWLVALLMGLAMTACGGGSDVGYVGAGKNTITVTATAGSQTASTQITLIVS